MEEGLAESGVAANTDASAGQRGVLAQGTRPRAPPGVRHLEQSHAG